MRHAMTRPGVRWLLAAGLLLGAGLLLCGAVHERQAYRCVAAVALPPDGRERSTPPLGSTARCDYRVVLSGVVACSLDGALYDAHDVCVPEEEPWAHNALELQPAGLVPAPHRPGSHDWVFVPAEGIELAGRPVVARLDFSPLAEGMYLPEDARGRLFEGALRLEVWERDRRRQALIAGALAAWSLLLLAAGTAQAWALCLARRLAPARGSEVAAALARVRLRRHEALAAAAASPEGAAAVRRRIDGLWAIADDEADAAERCRRALGPSPSGEGEAGEGRRRAGDLLRQHLRRLEEIEGVLADVPVRLALARASESDEPAGLARALDEELRTLESAAQAVRQAGRRS